MCDEYPVLDYPVKKVGWLELAYLPTLPHCMQVLTPSQRAGMLGMCLDSMPPSVHVGIQSVVYAVPHHLTRRLSHFVEN